jgi:hypothetical protein
VITCSPMTYGDKILNARGPDVNEIWVPLIEKAFAKLNGSYVVAVSSLSLLSMQQLNCVDCVVMKR